MNDSSSIKSQIFPQIVAPLVVAAVTSIAAVYGAQLFGFFDAGVDEYMQKWAKPGSVLLSVKPASCPDTWDQAGKIMLIASQDNEPDFKAHGIDTGSTAKPGGFSEEYYFAAALHACIKE